MGGATLDAGPLIGLERLDREVENWVAAALEEEVDLRVPAPVIAEVWRGGRRSAALARRLAMFEVVALDDATARRAGELLAAVGGSATVDAMVVATAAQRGDAVLTSDTDDLAPLARAAGVPLAVL